MQTASLSLTKFFYSVLSSQFGESVLRIFENHSSVLNAVADDDEFARTLISISEFYNTQQFWVSAEEERQAQNLVAGFSLEALSCADAVRIYFLLSRAEKMPVESLVSKIPAQENKQLTLSILCALSLFPSPQKYADAALEAVRSSDEDIAGRILFSNPYAAAHFNDDQWNEMILGAVKQGLPLYKIYGVDSRRSPFLSEAVLKYIKAEKSEHRLVSPEVWRLLTLRPTPEVLAEVEALFEQPHAHYVAALLFCAQCGNPAAKKILAQKSSLPELIILEKISWKFIGEKWSERAVNE